jgi:hypothetical protein
MEGKRGADRTLAAGLRPETGRRAQMRDYMRWQGFLSGTASVLVAVAVVGGYGGFLVGIHEPYHWPGSGLYWGALVGGILICLGLAGMLFGLAQGLNLLERLALGQAAVGGPPLKAAPAIGPEAARRDLGAEGDLPSSRAA